jgi:hypothetical protein
MRVLVAVLGAGLTLLVFLDAFEAIVLPRRVTRRFRLTRLFYRAFWKPWKAIAHRIHSSKRRESFLRFFGPLSLLMLLSLWAISLVVSFAMLQWALRLQLNIPQEQTGFGTYAYMSGVTLFTLGFGDVTPSEPLGRAMIVAEAGIGFGFLALIIGYLPVIYQSFSRREANISLLDARAGSPPSVAELLRRHGQNMEELRDLLRDWERWSADLMESHLSYPVLCFYRSQHNNQSWLTALTTILDASALLIVGIDGGPSRQAQLTFAIARHAVVDLSQIFNTPPRAPEPNRLSPGELTRLRSLLGATDIKLRDDIAADQKLCELRQMYEPYANALADYLFVTIPDWIPPGEAIDNWQTSAWGRISRGIASSPVIEPRDEEHS